MVIISSHITFVNCVYYFVSVDLILRWMCAYSINFGDILWLIFSFCMPLQILSFSQFGGYTLVRNSKDLFQSFGFDTQPVLIGLILFQVKFYWITVIMRAWHVQALGWHFKLNWSDIATFTLTGNSMPCLLLVPSSTLPFYQVHFKILFLFVTCSIY